MKIGVIMNLGCLTVLKHLTIELEVYTPKEDEIVTMYYGKSFTRTSPIPIKRFIKEAFAHKQAAAGEVETAASAAMTKEMITEALSGGLLRQWIHLSRHKLILSLSKLNQIVHLNFAPILLIF